MCDRQEWDKMLDKFYELNGWDKETSLQTRECMEFLQMQDFAETLRKTGKLR